MVIDIFRKKWQRGELVTVTPPGTQRRSFTHVEDIVDGLVLVGEVGERDEFGLGAEESFSILEIAEMFGAESKCGRRPRATGWGPNWILRRRMGSVGRPNGGWWNIFRA